MSEFIENRNKEYKKQDCERSASARLMERLKKAFPRLPICLCGDSLYACESFFQNSRKNGWRFLVRFKEGSIPTVWQEYESLKVIQKNEMERSGSHYDYVTDIDYRGMPLNFVHFTDKEGSVFNFLTDLPVTKKNVEMTVFYGRRRWKIENQGFNAQKKHGFYLEHLFSRNGQAVKNHYFLIQLAHMISQIMDAWVNLWKHIRLSGEQKHRRLLESWKSDRILEVFNYPIADYQIRFE